LSHLLIFIKGTLFGIANIIPGVSGGTFALILGIYERLIGSIRSLGLETVKALKGLVVPPGGKTRTKVLKDELRRTDAGFLGLLLLGAAVSILASSRLITFLLEEHLAPTLAFFVGLIVPSVLVPYSMLERKGWKEALACLLGAAALVCFTVFSVPVGGQGAGLFVLFVAGLISISAMILPGVSGSFVLLVMGEYKTVLDAIKHATDDFDPFAILQLAVFGAGCLVGLMVFVRLIHYLLKRFHSVTMAFLMGLIIGSLWALWPFKEGAGKIITRTNVFPTELTPVVLWSLGALVVGLLCSFGLNALGKKQDAGVQEPL
jgi:putative membrane protein